MRDWVVISVMAVAMAACEGKSSNDDGGGGDSGTGVTSMSGPGDGAVPTGGGDASMSGGASDGGATMGDSAGDTAMGSESGGGTGMDDPLNPLDCGGKVWACGDTEDNDGDGHIDLLDPECTGPCDDDESSFQTGIPGDNVDCKQDCFFDGNSGQGDDGCIWDLRCDPLNPGANINCEYTGGQNCNQSPPNQDEDCVMFCTQFVPPGCDCFGCCTVQTDEGEVHIFLNGDPACALDNLDACTMCTPNDSCGNPCVPEECDVCFGEVEPPEGCDEPGCSIPDLTSCSGQSDCPVNYFCLSGCCFPPPPG